MYVFNYVEQHLFLYGLVIQIYLSFEDFSAIVWAGKKNKRNTLMFLLL